MRAITEGERNRDNTWEGHLVGEMSGDGRAPRFEAAHETDGHGAASLQQLALVWEVLCALAVGVCAGLAARTQSWQAFAALGLGFAAAVLCRVSRRLSRHSQVGAAGCLLLIAGLAVPLLATLCISNATLLLAGLALVLPIGITSLVWPQRWLSWGLFPSSLAALACGLMERVVPWSRLSAAETPAAALVGAGFAAVGLASLLWVLAKRPPGADLRTRLLVSFLFVGAPPAATAVATTMAWRWLSSSRAPMVLYAGAAEVLVVPAAGWFIGASLWLGSVALSVALAVRLTKGLAIPSRPLIARRKELTESSDREGTMQLEQSEATRRAANEQRSQRMRELEQRCRNAEALVELSRVCLSLLDVQRLCRAVVDVVRDSLSQEYVALYALEPAQAWLELRAESGASRWSSPERKRRIPVGEGLVGRTAADVELKITAGSAQEPGGDATKAVPTQVALPLRSRGRVLGVLVVHAGLTGDLGRELVSALEAMASPIALALDNARLLEEGQVAIDAARRVSGTLSLDAWRDVLRVRTDLGFRSDEHGVQHAGRVWLPRMAQAGARNAAVLGRADDADQIGQTLTVPIRIHGEVIGVLDTRKPGSEGVWTSEQVALVEQIAEELSQALENARLYEETQRRGVRERQLREIATRMGGSADLDVIMQAAVEDVAKALGAPSAFVQLYERRPPVSNGSAE
jgi:GAF domain-containing protein